VTTEHDDEGSTTRVFAGTDAARLGDAVRAAEAGHAGRVAGYLGTAEEAALAEMVIELFGEAPIDEVDFPRQ
jgi:hypothetical protein